MKIGDEVYIHGYVDEIRKDMVIISNEGGYFGTSRDEVFYYEEDGTMNKTEPLTCDGNCWMKKQNGEWLCEHCQREPKNEPNADNSSSVAEVTTDCRQTKMTLDDAYYLVYKDLTKMDGVLTGKYDAKNGSKQYMNGVWSVMELIAYGVGIDCYEAFNERFCRNLEKSQEQAKEPETEREGE